MTCSLERSRKQLMNSSNNDRVGSLVFSSRSNEHSPRHTSLLTPTNYEQGKIDYTFLRHQCTWNSFHMKAVVIDQPQADHYSVFHWGVISVLLKSDHWPLCRYLTNEGRPTFELELHGVRKIYVEGKFI